MKRAALSIKIRREIKRKLNALKPDKNGRIRLPIKQLLFEYEKVGLTETDIYNIHYDRVKTEYSPRADKGHKYGARTKAERGEIAEDVDPSMTMDDLVEEQLRVGLVQLRTRVQIDPLSRIATVERVTRSRRHMLAAKLTGQLKRADAMLFARIIRRFKPDATDDEIVVIYQQEKAALEADLRES